MDLGSPLRCPTCCLLLGRGSFQTIGGEGGEGRREAEGSCEGGEARVPWRGGEELPRRRVSRIGRFLSSSSGSGSGSNQPAGAAAFLMAHDNDSDDHEDGEERYKGRVVNESPAIV